MAKNKEKIKFPGFPLDWDKNDFFKTPRELERCLFMLSGAEVKTLWLIIRQLGFTNPKTKEMKTSDKISLSQFQNGIGKNNKGTGLSKGSIISGINGLVDKGIIWAKKANRRVSEYGLVVQKLEKTGSNLEGGGSNTEQGSGSKTEHTVDNNNRDFTKEKYIKKLVWFYQVRICPDSRLTSKGKSRIAERLEEYSPDELAEAIINFSESDWNMENNSHRGVAWFFATEDRIDSFRNLKPIEKEEELRRGTYSPEEDKIE
ncbi:MAG: hypothetical protein UV65_C0003G0023 [Parcubacteria group bacterium GW2011_GWF2_43_11]|nr:MAG: hypothetical protein UV65_C0003G0023 [Parcubacteria group bacterium GW2011_GWF2_43_11]